MLTREQAKLVSVIAVTSRYRPDDIETIDGARRDLRVSLAVSYLTDLLATTPPPTATQRAQLARLLRAGASS